MSPLQAEGLTCILLWLLRLHHLVVNAQLCIHTAANERCRPVRDANVQHTPRTQNLPGLLRRVSTLVFCAQLGVPEHRILWLRNLNRSHHGTTLN